MDPKNNTIDPKELPVTTGITEKTSISEDGIAILCSAARGTIKNALKFFAVEDDYIVAVEDKFIGKINPEEFKAFRERNASIINLTCGATLVVGTVALGPLGYQRLNCFLLKHGASWWQGCQDMGNHSAYIFRGGKHTAQYMYTRTGTFWNSIDGSASILGNKYITLNNIGAAAGTAAVATIIFNGSFGDEAHLWGVKPEKSAWVSNVDDFSTKPQWCVLPDETPVESTEPYQDPQQSPKDSPKKIVYYKDYKGGLGIGPEDPEDKPGVRMQ